MLVNTKTFRSFLITFVAMAAMLSLSACDPVVPPVPTTGPIVTTTPPAGQTYDLASYYPNTEIYKTKYLNGETNLQPFVGMRSVLWFEWQGQGTFKMYNSAPGAAEYQGRPNTSRCHYDVLSWWNINGDVTLRYSKTYDECTGVVKETVYDPPIIFLPGTYNTAKPWSLDYSATAKHYVNGKLSCVGVNDYKAEIHGTQNDRIPNSDKFEKNLLWSTTQKTTWTAGNYEVNSQCSTGGVTDWKENYVLSDNVAVEGGSPAVAKGLRHAYGGNADGVHDQWDITFNSWKILPQL